MVFETLCIKVIIVRHTIHQLIAQRTTGKRFPRATIEMSAPNPKKEKQAQQGGSKKGNPQQKGSSQQQKQKAPPKAKSNFNADDMKADQKLQAIILADSFAKTFRPITLECPKVLLPLVNVPMLDYTIEFLSQNGVEEVDKPF